MTKIYSCHGIREGGREGESAHNAHAHFRPKVVQLSLRGADEGAEGRALGELGLELFL